MAIFMLVLVIVGGGIAVGAEKKAFSAHAGDCAMSVHTASADEVASASMMTSSCIRVTVR